MIDTVIENLKTRIISEISNVLNLPMRVSYDEDEFQFTVEIFSNTNDHDGIWEMMDEISDLEDKLFPNVEYMITPIIYTKLETEKYFTKQ